MLGNKTLNNPARQESSESLSSIALGPASRFAVAIATLIVVWFVTSSIFESIPAGGYIIAAAIIGAYMAINIGANDVANNVGPAVGAKAISIGGALILAALCETLGAVIAGGDVVKTISKDIIDPSKVANTLEFIWAMMAALFAAAIWVNVATWLNAPVSTTHSIVGGVMGAGVACLGFGTVNWAILLQIAISWVISPLLGGLIAAALLWFIGRAILDQTDRLAAARTWVPVLVGIMAGIFAAYLMIKGLKRVWTPTGTIVIMVSILAMFLVYAATRPVIARSSKLIENKTNAISSLFIVPLVFAAALLSFAHGANDVANAIGPLAAVVQAVEYQSVAIEAEVPVWVMILGGVGIAIGLGLFGSKLIRTVGKKITKLDPIRAYCVALSAAITVLVATQLALPVSSTHIAIGSIFGVGFLREYLANKRMERVVATKKSNKRSLAAINALDAMKRMPGEDQQYPTSTISKEILDAAQLKKLKKKRKRKLVRRSHLITIIAAWIVTVPCSAVIAALLFFATRGALLP